MSEKPKCIAGCRMVPILPDLWLCDHASYGRMSHLKGCVDEARRLMARWGGYAMMRAEQDRVDEEAKAERKAKREEGVALIKSRYRKG